MTMNVKRAPPPGGPELDLIDLAIIATARDRWFLAHDALEGADRVGRRLAALGAEPRAIGRIVYLAEVMRGLSSRELDAALDQDRARSARLRRQFWAVEAELVGLLARLDAELDALLGL